MSQLTGNKDNPNLRSFEDTAASKLRKRIHLPADLQSQTHEERHILSRYIGADSIEVNPLKNWMDNYGRHNGWSKTYLQPVLAITQAKRVEVIVRRHKLGNFLLFRVWQE